MERQSQTQHQSDTGVRGNGRATDRPDAIQQDIHRTRERIDETLDAIKQQLSPGDLLSQVMSMFRQEGGSMNIGTKAGDLLSSLAHTIKENPIPVALIGIGLLGLAKDGGGKDRGFSQHGIAERSAGAGQVTEKIEGMAEEARERVSEAAEGAREKVQGMAEEARETLERVRDRIEDDPIVLGALGIALGAALGAGLPRTRTEDRAFGEKRDELAAKAKQMGEQIRQGVKQAVTEEARQSPQG